MKKIIIGAVVALLALAWPAATWWTGKQVETRLADNARKLEDMPFMKVVKRDFKRGFGSSTEDVTIELFGGFQRAIEQSRKDDAAANAAADMLQPMQLTFRSTIQHGPFAGGKVAAAVVDSEMILDAKTNEALTKAFGGKKPLTARTVFDYGGAGRTSMQSPAMTTTLQGEDGEPVSIAWDGMTADVEFSVDMKRLVMSGKAPKFELKGAKGEQMVMSGMQLSGQQTRVFDDEPLLYGGKQRLEIARFEFSAPKTQQVGDAKATVMSIENMVYDVDTPIAGEFIDIVAKMGAAKFVIDQQDYGPANYDTSFKRMHARTVAGLYRDMMKMYADPALLAGKPDPAMILGPMMQRAQELLKHNPEFAIDRISFKSPQGEGLVSARVALKDVKPDDLSNAAALIPKIDATAKVVLPEAMLAEMSASRAETPEEKNAQRQMFTMQVQSFSDQGYVVRKGAMLESTIVFKDGQLTVNGKPLGPMGAMGARGQGDPQGQRPTGPRGAPRKRP